MSGLPSALALCTDARSEAELAAQAAGTVSVAERTALSPSIERLLGRAEPSSVGTVEICELVGLTEPHDEPLLSIGEGAAPRLVVARSVVELRTADIGRRVLVVYETREPERPIVVGLLHEPRRTPPPVVPELRVESAGEHLIVSPKSCLTIRCGKSSIVLHRDGRIVIRGTQVVTHADGVNRIRGGSVQIN